LAEQSHGCLAGPVTRPLAYRRVRWLLAAAHALVPYGAVENIAASAWRGGQMIASRRDE
jgi:hypothetical protein